MFHFFYKILNAPSQKITFLRNFYHLFCQCRFLCEIQLIMTVSDFSGCLSGNRFLEGGFTFQWRKGVVFQLGASSCLSGAGGTHWGASVLIGQGSTIGVCKYAYFYWHTHDFGNAYVDMHAHFYLRLFKVFKFFLVF